MKRTITLGISLFLSATFVFGQVQGDGGIPHFKGLSTKNLSKVSFAQPDIAALKAEDAIVDAEKSGPWRFGYNNETNLTLENSGSWTTLPNGGQVWRLKMTCQEALTVNLTLDNVSIPEGNELYVYNEDKSFILGKFTANHLYMGKLGTELVPGNTVIAEYYVAPGNDSKDASLRIARVTHGYRTANEFVEKAFGSSGSCNMNVACPDGLPWEDPIRSAVMLVSGSSGFCSGALINNTQNDGKPYVLTANHCYSDPTSWIFRFNWQSATCVNPGGSPSFQSLSGAVLRARRTPSDFCLVEITGGLEGGTVPCSYNAYFSGWDNSGVNPTSTVSIHHPSGDIKKISFDDAASFPVQAMGSSEANSSWQVEWDRNTTTEGGSSGSPLFDQNQRIIGQLWGGGASCSNLTAPDYYGRVFNSWEPAGSNSTNQLKVWLDPTLSGVTSIDGFDPCTPAIDDDARMYNISSPSGSTCETDVNGTVTIKNNGTLTMSSADIIYGIDGSVNTYNWSGSLASGATEVVNLPTLTSTAGAHTFYAKVELSGDGNPGNDSLAVAFTIINPTPVVLPIVQDFEGAFPGAWTNDNPDASYGWGVTAVGFASSNSMTIDNYNYNASGARDSYISPFFSLTDAITGVMSFDVAYTPYATGPNYSDTLIVEISTDCGTTWESIYYKGGMTLSTTGATSDGFTPAGDGEWRNEVIDLAAYLGAASVQVRVVNKNNYGNEMYVDNINISASTLGLNEVGVSNFTVYPNPSKGTMTVQFASLAQRDVRVIDLAGRTVYNAKSTGATAEINLNVEQGNYLIIIEENGIQSVKKLVIQ